MLRKMPLIQLLLVYFVIVGMATPSQAQWQAKNMQDVVYLKNGGIIRGNLLEITDTFKVVIETEGRNRFVFEREEVARLAREREILPLKEKGYINYTEAGLLIGRSSQVWNNATTFYYLSPSFQTFNGYQFAPGLQVGVTAGVDLYNNVALVPVALGVKGNLGRKMVSPYYSLDYGYGFNWLNENNRMQKVSGGRMWQPGLGIKVAGKNGSAFILSLSYKSQKAQTFSDQNWRVVQEQLHFQRFALRTGISF